MNDPHVFNLEYTLKNEKFLHSLKVKITNLYFHEILLLGWGILHNSTFNTPTYINDPKGANRICTCYARMIFDVVNHSIR